MRKKTKIIILLTSIIISLSVIIVIVYNFCPVYVPDFMLGSATIQGTSFDYEEITPSELTETKSILCNKWYSNINVSTDEIPMYSFPEHISIKSGILVFVPAGSGAHYVKLGNKYTEISGMEQSELENIFYNHGQFIMDDI